MRGSGPDADIVISSRVRLARNAAKYPCLSKLGEDRRDDAAAELCQAVMDGGLGRDPVYFDLYDTAATERKMLVERHLISRELEDGAGRRGVAISPEENLSVMVLEEDHLRLQVLRSGFDLRGAWAMAVQLDDAVESKIEYAYDEKIGYLTACPTNVGTGLRVSVMVHLPALVTAATVS